MTDDIRWTMRREDQGQAIHVEYALTEDGEYALRRTTDSDGDVTIERSECALDDEWSPYITSAYDEPPVDGWELIEAPCCCACECPGRYREGEGTTDDDCGWPRCDECFDYYFDSNGEVVCSRQQDQETCRHCQRPIHWGSIQTGSPGTSNWIEGECSCRAWRQTEFGGRWVMAEAEEWSSDGRYAVVAGGEDADAYQDSHGDQASALRHFVSIEEAREYAEAIARDYHYGVEIIDTSTWETC